MRTQPTFVILMTLVITSMLLAEDSSGGSKVQVTAAQSPIVTAEETVLADVMSVPEPLPRAAQDLLEDYEAELGTITQRFSAPLLVNANAVQRGELTSEQGQKLSAKQYQTSQMQFELLSVWRAMLEHDLASVPPSASNANPVPAKENEMLWSRCRSSRSNSILQSLST